MITIPETTKPAVLYKYYPPERIDIIESQDLRFSAPREFNDAFDSYHLLPRSSDVKANVERMKLRNELGILCLTERADNQTMWVNYAKNHTGFVMGFDPSSPFFCSDGRVLRRVIYQDRPPIFPTADDNACFYKAPAWHDEQEWRCIKRFSLKESRLVGFDWPLVREIIFGSKIDRSLISRIVNIVTAYAPYGAAPTYSFSTLSLSDWRIVNRPKRLTMCEHCGGEGYIEEDGAAVAST